MAEASNSGHSNGVVKTTTTSKTYGSMGAQQVTVLRDVTVQAKSTSSRTYGSSIEESQKSMSTIDSFLDYVAAERLRHMPHPGSKLDRVLAYAAFFASQTRLFVSATEEHVPHTQEAAKTIWANLHLLLEMGPEKVDHLERLFVVYYSMGQVFSSLVEWQDFFSSSTEVQSSLSLIFSNVVRLVVGTAAEFGQTRSTQPSTLSSEIYRKFGTLVVSIYSSKDQIFDLLWGSSIKSEGGMEAYHVEIQTIRTFLSSSDRIVRTLTSSSVTALGSRGSRAEHTCEWMRPFLMDFIRGNEKVLVVQGRSGAGKTFLSGWIAECLQRLEGKKVHHDTISFSIERDVCTETSMLSVAKGLLLQLFDRNVGNSALYRILCEVLEASSHGKPAEEIEQGIWRAIDTSLGNLSNIMIIVDGLDQIDGGETTGLKLLEKLNQLGAKHTHTRAIVLSQPLTKAAPQGTRAFAIEPSYTTKDIRHQVRATLASTSQFQSLKDADRDRIIQRVSTAADGSFILSEYFLELLKRQNTVTDMLKTLDNLPKTIQEALTIIQTFIDLNDKDTRSLVAWLLAAQRPLTLEETKVFLEIDLPSSSHTPRFSEVEQDVIKAVGPIVTISNGTVRFKHDTIRTHFTSQAASVKDYSNSSSFPFMVTEAHFDLTARCVAYTKLFVTRRVNATFDRLDLQLLSDLYQQHTALEYSATYWLSHFRQSPMYDSSGKHNLVPEFRSCFSDSTLLAQIEGSIWSPVQTPDFELALHLRETIIGQESMAVLQNIINLARVLELVSREKASSYYYRAYDLVHTLLGEDVDVLTKIAVAYLTCSFSVTITEKNEMATQREKMLKRIITVYKETYGASHTTTVKYTRMLAQLYTDTKQFDLATDYWQEVYEIYVQIYGQLHSETSTVYQTLEKTLKQSSKKEDIKTITRSRYETTQDLAVTDTQRTTVEEETIEYYDNRKEYQKVESIIIDQWRSASEAAATSQDAHVHKRKLDITQRYVTFLKQQNRHEEARTILEGVATEYQERKVGSDSMASSFHSLGQEMKELNMLKTARSTFSSLASYYHSSGTASTSQAAEVTRNLEETTQQLIETTTGSTTSKTDTKIVTDESALTEILESLTTQTESWASTSTRFASIIKTSQKLSVHYYHQQKFGDCFRVCSQALAIVWPYFISRQGTVRLPSEYQTEVVALALRMGECTWALGQIEKTEDIYVTVFKATKNTVKITDDLYSLTSQTLTDYYEQTYQIHKFLATNKEIYSDQKTQLGASNAVTIKTAYRIANYCIRQSKYKDAEPYFVDIWTAMTSSGNIPVDAIPAAEQLLIIYDQDARWESAEKLCSTLWETFVKRGTEARFSTDFVEHIYKVYFHVLEEERKVSHEELYKLTKTYKETCQKVFGERNELTLKARLQFAQVCERSESHQKEALTVYEEAVKQAEAYRSTSTTTSTTTSIAMMQTVSIARQNLATLYTKQSVKSETASKYVNSEYESTRTAYGTTDQRSLDSLSQLVEYNHKQSKTESTQQSVRLLQTAVVETIKKEKTHETLIESAVKIAQSYIKVNQTETAWELYYEIRRQVITGQYTTSKKYNFSLEGTDRRAYVFIIAFGQALKGESATTHFSEQMADLLTEATLYQAYHKSVSDKAKFEIVFIHGSRLATFYLNKDRKSDYDRIWNELLELLAASLHVSKTNATLREFFEVVISEIHQGNYDTTIAQIGAERVLTKMKASKFQEALDFATFTHKFTELLSDWCSEEKVESGLLICMYLMGRHETPKPKDQKLWGSMVEISRAILAAVMQAARELNIRFTEMSLKQINDIVALLGEQQNYRDLEWLLTQLWNSRHHQSSLDSVTIVWIGRRLIEVRFAAGHREAAISLCEDVLYNVRRVWGPSDQVTVQIVDLLAELYSAVGDHAQALATHEEMLRRVIVSVDEEGEISKEHGAQIAAQELELMKRSYQRNGGWGNRDANSFKNLYNQLSSLFGKEKAFANVQSIEKWSAKEKADGQGIWQQPSSFEIAGISQQTHKNHLRWSSGLFTNTATRHRRTSSKGTTGSNH